MLCHARFCSVVCDRFGNRSLTCRHALGNLGICRAAFTQLKARSLHARHNVHDYTSCMAAECYTVLTRTMSCALVADEDALALLHEM